MTKAQIQTEAEYDAAISRLDELWNKVQPGTPEGDEVEALVERIVEYEARVYPAPEQRPDLTAEELLAIINDQT